MMKEKDNKKMLNDEELSAVAGGAPAVASPERKIKNYAMEAVKKIQSGKMTYKEIVDGIRGHESYFLSQFRAMGSDIGIEEFIALIDSLLG